MNLQAQKRETKTKLKNLRSEGFLPAVFYGKEEASTPITLNKADFIKLYNKAGHSTIIDLEVKGDKESKDILINDIQTDPVTGKFLHVDLYVVTRGEEMETAVSFEFIGEAPAEKKGAVIMKTMYEIPLKTMPRDLPSHIDIDLSALKEVGQSIHVNDIVVPKGVTLLAEPDEIVATATAEREIEEEEPEEIDMSAIEVEQKGKDEESKDTSGEKEN